METVIFVLCMHFKNECFSLEDVLLAKTKEDLIRVASKDEYKAIKADFEEYKAIKRKENSIV